MNWDDMKLFLAIAETGGLKKAARRLDMHHSSCARRIKAFEQDLELKLFDRLAGGYQLTTAGEALLKSAHLIRDEFNAIEHDLAGKDTKLAGPICVTLPNGFACNLLMPDIHQFMQRYPEVQVEINMSYSRKDLSKREADVAIRHVDNPLDSLAGKRVGQIYQSAYASVDYLQQHDPINQPERCHWLGWGKPENHLSWAEKHKFENVPVRGDFYSDVLQLAAVKANMGIASLPCFMADTDPQLVRLPGTEAIARDWIWVLAHKDMMTNARVRIFIEFIAQSFADKQRLIKGQCYRVT